MKRKVRKHSVLAWSALLLLSLLVCSQAGAQVTTASIGGTVGDVSGPLPGASVTAKNVQSAFVYQTTAGEDGIYAAAAASLPAPTRSQVSSEAYKPQTRTVTVLLGQDRRGRLRALAGPTVLIADADGGRRGDRSCCVETRTLRESPPTSPRSRSRTCRRTAATSSASPPSRPASASPTTRTTAGQKFRSGGADARQVNVFIDGLSYKNDILRAAPSCRTPAAATRSRRTRCRSSGSSPRTTRPSTRRPRRR